MFRYEAKARCFICKIAFLFVLLFSFSTQACDLTIRVATTFDWPPYIYKSPQGVTGLEVETLDIILEKTPFCRQFVEMPSSSRAIQELKNQRVDVLISATFSKERALYSVFSESYRDERMILFTQKTQAYFDDVWDEGSFLEMLNTNENIIAVNNGSIYGAKFEAFLKRYQGGLTDTTLAKQRFDMLKKDRIDYAIEDELAGWFLLKDRKYSNDIRSTNILVNDDKIYYMLRPNLMTEKQLKIFNQAIIDSRSQIDQLIRRYTKK